MEKLQIKNFAGLKDVTIEVKPITGFIGPQASGKSIIAKLLYFFREISSRLPAAIAAGLDHAQYQAVCLKRFVRYFPIESIGESNFEIIYQSGSENVRIIFAKNGAPSSETLNVEWSGFFVEAIKRFMLKKRPLLDPLGDVDDGAVDILFALREAYDEEASKVLGPWSRSEQIFIPTGRVFLSQLKASVVANFEAIETVDPFMSEFAIALAQSENYLAQSGLFAASETDSPLGGNSNETLRSIFKPILRAKIGWLEKQYYLSFEDGRRVKPAQASSGHQEVVPLLFILAHFFLVGRKRGRVLYIEEPEAHLFPSTQKQIVEFMATVFRARQGKVSFVLTTHSPYILTSINNLLQAGSLYKGASPDVKKRLESVIPLSRILKPGEVAFYALENGSATSIIDSETGLIDAAMIDSVSDEIATQFDELLMEGNEKR